MSRYRVTFDDGSEYLVEAPDEAAAREHVATPAAVTKLGGAKQIASIALDKA